MFCRPQLWFWNSIVLVLTLLLPASQVFAIALDTYFQLTIMLLILILGVTAFAFFHPFTDGLLQGMQVRVALCWKTVSKMKPRNQCLSEIMTGSS